MRDREQNTGPGRMVSERFVEDYGAEGTRIISELTTLPILDVAPAAGAFPAFITILRSFGS